jgi:hypothetical protein
VTKGLRQIASELQGYDFSRLFEAVKKLAKGSKSQNAAFDNQLVARVNFHDFQFLHTFFGT